MNIETLLAERGKTHGNFADNARVAQAIKRLFLKTRLTQLNDVQAEGLDLIALKLSRILTGSSDNPDNWDDIAGYAKRVADELRLPSDQGTS
jgi:hypothetical protein